MVPWPRRHFRDHRASWLLCAQDGRWSASSPERFLLRGLHDDPHLDVAASRVGIGQTSCAASIKACVSSLCAVRHRPDTSSDPRVEGRRWIVTCRPVEPITQSPVDIGMKCLRRLVDFLLKSPLTAPRSTVLMRLMAGGVLLIAGPGRWSLDALVQRRRWEVTPVQKRSEAPHLLPAQ
jgi:hypothetical protein